MHISDGSSSTLVIEIKIKMNKVRWVAWCCVAVGMLNGFPALAQTSETVDVNVEVLPENNIETSVEQEADTQLDDTAEATEREEERKRPPRGYIGIGGNVGLSGGQTSISEGGFTIINRTQLTNYLAIRGGVVIGDGTTSTLALTGEFPIAREGARVRAIPFAGLGISIDDDIAPMISTGVDIPVNNNFTMTNRVNVSFGDEETDVGVLVGVGYNFSLLELFR